MSLSLISSPWSTDRRSRTAFDVPSADAAAIVKVVSFPRGDLAQAVISFPRKHHDVVRPSLKNPFPTEPIADLGVLTALPLELLGQILLHHLDLRSVITFRNLNHRARHVTDSLHEYQALTTHGLDFICALLRTGLASHRKVTLATIHALLCSKSCSICGHFGSFVSLACWARCCFTCLQFAPELFVQTLADETSERKLKPRQIDRLIIMRTLPGKYSTWGTYQTGGIHLVARLRPKSRAAHHPWHDPLSFGPNYQYVVACALPYLDNKTGDVEAGVACAGCQLALSKDLEAGTFSQRSNDVAERTYTKEGFLEHFRWCRYGQDLWNSSGGGQFQPPEMPLVAKMCVLYM
jgi:hypothetical protein